MSDLKAYRQLIAKKAIAFEPQGLKKIPALNSAMFPYQEACTEFALRTGCAGLFLSTGLGKSLCSLDWGRVIVEKTNKPVLMLAPLAVSKQHEREAEKFGVDAKAIREPEEINGKRIYVTNYERLAKFEGVEWGAVVLDESSILKGFNGRTSRALIETFAGMPFRLSATATPAPNDHMELGQQSEFLGCMRSMEMLSRWFINDTSTASQVWRLKGHAVESFWNWVASWARCATRPSDLGFDDASHILPELIEIPHTVDADLSANAGQDATGQHLMFRAIETSATSIHNEKRLTAKRRAQKAYEIVMEDWGCLGNLNTQSAAELNPKLTLTTALEETSKATVLTEMLAAHTFASTQYPIKTELANSGKPRQQLATRRGAKDTQRTQSTETEQRQQHDLIQQESVETASAENLGSLKTSMKEYSQSREAGAPFASAHPEASVESGWQSIIATQQDTSEACCAQTAIEGSVCSGTTLISLRQQASTSREKDWWLIWCETDYDQNEVEHLFGDAAVSIKGSDSERAKEEKHDAWMSGERKILICKPKMFGFGLNWQHCHKMIFVGLLFSFESYHQAVRRCWRFGQTQPVHVHTVMASSEKSILDVINRKKDGFEEMGDAMRAAMLRACNKQIARVPYEPKSRVKIPAFMGVSA